MGYDAYWFYDPPTVNRPVTAPVTRFDWSSIRSTNESLELPNVTWFVDMNIGYEKKRH